MFSINYFHIENWHGVCNYLYIEHFRINLPLGNYQMTDINKETISILNDLIETSKDGEEGFRTSAEHAKSAQVKSFLTNRSTEVAAAVRELQAEVTALGGKPEDSSSVSGALHRAWVNLKSMVTSDDDKAVLEEVEKGEDVAKKAYREALEKARAKNVSPNVIALIEKQQAGVLANHDKVKALRDAARAAHAAS
ncbi:Aldehyde dehydrogenase [Pseudomonas savastanoi]|uniref:Aldehyde dehydrogenase n=4 Tax=Pseudomonas syringae group genomosp. 2 TaxID=251698 RepID=A0A3M5J8M8_PSESS|nr:Aldehyde dehydrogenase [Pseudomonas savastanoi]RMT19046.1 Aldehyde dehydrogenase [Pseudomonas savastanoi]